MNANNIEAEQQRKVKKLERRYKELEKQEKELRKVNAIDEDFVAKHLKSIIDEKGRIAKILGI